VVAIIILGVGGGGVNWTYEEGKEEACFYEMRGGILIG
jgi:hypothetical protein